MKIAIVDDCMDYILEIEGYIKKYVGACDVTLYKYTNELAFLKDLRENQKMDIIFLDIMLNNLNGIDVGREINKYLPRASLIFLSGNVEYYKMVYQVNHMYFITKPIDEKIFKAALFKAIKSTRDMYITVNCKNLTEKIYVDDVLYVESALRHIIFHLKGGKKIEEFKQISIVENQLPPCFVRCQKSYIVNLVNVENIVGNKINFENNEYITISRRKVVEIRDMYTNCLGGELI